MNKLELKEALMAQGYEELLTVRECADIFKTSISHVYKKIGQGDMPASDNKFTGKKLVLLDDVCEELATEKVGR
jgi:predicted DNA-binding transcriptional regulator AlpA